MIQQQLWAKHMDAETRAAIQTLRTRPEWGRLRKAWKACSGGVGPSSLPAAFEAWTERLQASLVCLALCSAMRNGEEVPSMIRQTADQFFRPDVRFHTAFTAFARRRQTLEERYGEEADARLIEEVLVQGSGA